MSKKVHTGWFIDWDGNARKTETPGNGYRCIVEGNTAEVIKSDGEVIYTATYWPDFEVMEQWMNDVGCFIKFA